MNILTRSQIPYPVLRQIGEVLTPDTSGGKEKSPSGRLVLAYNANRFEPRHRAALRSEARNLLNIILDADEWEEFEVFANEKRELEQFIAKL